ncbi:MAG: hypothetical protein JXQ90_01670 [Cyclobacteriaceae bacterium]
MRIQLLALSFLIVLVGCSNDDEPCNCDAGGITISANTRDTILTVNSLGVDLTVPISLPTYGEMMPAVIVMHGSGGNWDDEDTDNDGIDDIVNEWELSRQNKDWKEMLNEDGFVSAFPGSYYPRGTIENAGEWKDPPKQFKISATFVRNHDAYAVLKMLKTLQWDDGKKIVDPLSVGILGFSHGGTAVQSTIYDLSQTPDNWTWTQSIDGVEYSNEIGPPVVLPLDGLFKAAVVYYPGSFHNGYYGNPCSETSIYKPYCDLMIHVAEMDPLTKNSLCLINHLLMNEPDVALSYFNYEEASHSFDGKDDGTDGEASTLARIRTRAFFNDRLK